MSTFFYTIHSLYTYTRIRKEGNGFWKTRSVHGPFFQLSSVQFSSLEESSSVRSRSCHTFLLVWQDNGPEIVEEKRTRWNNDTFFSTLFISYKNIIKKAKVRMASGGQRGERPIQIDFNDTKNMYGNNIHIGDPRPQKKRTFRNTLYDVTPLHHHIFRLICSTE
jgi:hypothetical protein